MMSQPIMRKCLAYLVVSVMRVSLNEGALYGAIIRGIEASRHEAESDAASRTLKWHLRFQEQVSQSFNNVRATCLQEILEPLTIVLRAV